MDVEAGEEVTEHVDGVALCDGVEVEFDGCETAEGVAVAVGGGDGVDDAVSVGLEEGHEGVDLLGLYVGPFFEAEAIEVDEGADAAVEGSFGVESDGAGFVEEVEEEG